MDEGMILDCMKCKRWNLFSEYYHIKGHFASIRCDDKIWFSDCQKVTSGTYLIFFLKMDLLYTVRCIVNQI